jgi:hypothetical protein
MAEYKVAVFGLKLLPFQAVAALVLRLIAITVGAELMVPVV